MKPMKNLSFAVVLLAITSHSAIAGTDVAQSAPAVSAASTPSAQNTHKERDHRFKQCKAAAQLQGVVKTDLQTFMANCLSAAPSKD
jgi:hypothetical protein